jgi:protein-tyrosine-phosphatase
MTRKTPHAVLFICTQNAIRSPMAAAIMHAALGSRIYVASAGIVAGDPDPFVGIVMEEIGLDLTRHRPHSVEDLADHGFDLAITLSPEAKTFACELVKTQAIALENWNIDDPSKTQGNRETILAAYREVRETLKRQIEERFAA